MIYKRFSVSLLVAFTLITSTSGLAKEPAASKAKAVAKKPAPTAQEVIPPTYTGVKYGPAERNLMDVWLAESDKPTPVLVSIHGGGFMHGDRDVPVELLRECLKAKISVVAITYRFTDEAIAPAQLLDAARAVQFIRHNAKKWNIDPTRIASTGGSAGAGLSLLLGFHDDMADPNSADPVLRESTRLTCVISYGGQSSYDPRFIRDLLPGSDTYKHYALANLFGANLDNLDNLPPEKYKLFEEMSAITHLTKDDAPTLLLYNIASSQSFAKTGDEKRDLSIGIHHPRFGDVLKKKMDELGVECQMTAGISWTRANGRKQMMDFLKKHLLENK